MFLQMHSQCSTPDPIKIVVERLRPHFLPPQEPGATNRRRYDGRIDESGFELTKATGLGRISPVILTGTIHREGSETVIRARIHPVNVLYVGTFVIVAWALFCLWMYLANIRGEPSGRFFAPEIVVATGAAAFVLAWQALWALISLIVVRRDLESAIRGRH